MDFNLLKSNEADFRSHVATLTDKAKQINEAQTRRKAEKSAAEARAKIEQQKRDFITEANQLIQNMHDNSIKIDEVIKYMTQEETRCHAITSKVRLYFERCQRLTGYQNSVLRNEAIAVMNGEIYNTNGMAINFQSIKANYLSNFNSLLKELAEMTYNCPSKDERVSAACQKLDETGAAFRAKCVAVADVLNRVEKTYRDELAAQQAMIYKANQVR
jgi:uncharacterized phage infection (PIP) family protein YhgE